MSATTPANATLTLRGMQRAYRSILRSASKEYRRQRVELTAREVMEETAEEIRRAVRGIITTAATD